jgi:hypothetical protein
MKMHLGNVVSRIPNLETQGVAEKNWHIPQRTSALRMATEGSMNA